MPKQNLNLIWKEIVSSLKNKLKEHSFNTWVKSMQPLAFDNNVFYIAVPNHFSKNWLKDRYSFLFKETISDIVDSDDVEVQFLLEDEYHATVAAGRKNGVFSRQENNLNPRYTFDNFVVGNSNRFAHAAALAVAESPAEAYNPLFIYGGVGLGKTHLMHAIGHYIRSKSKNYVVTYVTSEIFTNELINAIRDDSTVEFRNKYRNVDILLIDDIQFLAGKERTQEEFFHTFNTLYEASKQIVISSDRPPKEIPTLEDRLRSRFEWGLIADIQPPDFETRIAIIQKKAQLEGFNVPDDTVYYIAEQIQSNIRELEGALIRIIAYSSLTKQEITPELAAEILKDMLPARRPRQITPELIQQVVAEFFNIRVEDLKAKKRTRAVAFPRQVAMYLCRELTELSLPQIGNAFGGRDHTTVMHAHEKISFAIQKDPSLNEILKKIIAKIKE